MATWTPDTLQPTPFGWGASGPQYTTSPDGTRFQMLSGGSYRAPDGSIITDPNSWLQTSQQTGTMKDLISSRALGGGGNGDGGGLDSAGAGRFSSGLSDAETRLRTLLDDPNAIQQTAAYKFRVGQGQEALQRSLGAKGLLRSGNRLTELTKYGQDMASQEYDTQANRLASLLGTYGQFYNQARNTDEQAKLGYANIWARMNQPSGSGGSTRNISQLIGPNTGMTSYGMQFGGGVY